MILDNGSKRQFTIHEKTHGIIISFSLGSSGSPRKRLSLLIPTADAKMCGVVAVEVAGKRNLLMSNVEGARASRGLLRWTCRQVWHH
jgi:hypothetical protein